MKKIFTIIILSILTACNNDYNNYIEREIQLNIKEYDLFKSKLEDRYKNNKVKVREFKEISEHVDSLFLEVTSNIEQGDHNKINEKLINIIEFLKTDNHFMHSNDIQNIILTNRISSWINSKVNNDELFRLDMIISKNKIFQNLYYSIGKHDLEFNSAKVIVVDQSSTIKLGKIYEANVFFAARDTTILPKIRSTKLLEYREDILRSNYKEKLVDLEIENGVGIFKCKPNEIGKKVLIGTYSILNTNGSTSEFLFYKEIEVVK